MTQPHVNWSYYRQDVDISSGVHMRQRGQGTALTEVLIDIEAATRCDAFVGTFDAGLAKVMLARQV